MVVLDTYLEKVILDAERIILDGEYFEGKALLENVLSYEPGSAKVHNLMGWLYLYYLLDDVMAEKHLKLAMKFEPEFRAPYLHLVELYTKELRYDDLEMLLESAKNVAGVSNSLIYSRLGMVDESRGNFKRAIDLYKTAMFHSMDNFEIEDLKGNIKRCKVKSRRLRFRFWRFEARPR